MEWSILLWGKRTEDIFRGNSNHKDRDEKGGGVEAVSGFTEPNRAGAETITIRRGI